MVWIDDKMVGVAASLSQPRTPPKASADFKHCAKKLVRRQTFSKIFFASKN
jgi:hypothetical protein